MLVKIAKMLIDDINKVLSTDLLLTISFLIFWNLQIFAFVAGLFSLPILVSIHLLNHFSTGSKFPVSVILSSYMHMQSCTQSKKLHAQQSIYMHSAGVHVRISNPDGVNFVGRRVGDQSDFSTTFLFSLY